MGFKQIYEKILNEAVKEFNFKGADLEYILCYCQNRYNLGMSSEQAFKAAGDIKDDLKNKIKTFAESNNRGEDIADELAAAGIRGVLKNANKESIGISGFWSSFGCKDKTPKTDIFDEGGHKISLKDQSGGQYMSGRDNEARATLEAALKMCGNNIDSAVANEISSLYKNASIKTVNMGVIESGDRAGHHYGVTEFVEDLFKDKKNGEEMIKLFKDRSKGNNFGEFKKKFGDVVKTNVIRDKKKRQVLEDLVKASIENEKLDKKVAKVFSDPSNEIFRKNFVKECVTGTNKFGKENQLGIANYIMMFDANAPAILAFAPTNDKLFAAKAKTLKVTVNFKSTGGVAARAMRAEGGSLFDSFEYDELENMVNESLDVCSDEMLNEGFMDSVSAFFSGAGKAIKEIAENIAKNMPTYVDIVNKIGTTLVAILKPVVAFVFRFLVEMAGHIIVRLGQLIFDGWDAFRKALGFAIEVSNPTEALESGNISADDMGILKSLSSI